MKVLLIGLLMLLFCIAWKPKEQEKELKVYYKPTRDLSTATWKRFTPEQIRNKYCGEKYDPLTGSKIKQ